MKNTLSLLYRNDTICKTIEFISSVYFDIYTKDPINKIQEKVKNIFKNVIFLKANYYKCFSFSTLFTYQIA